MSQYLEQLLNDNGATLTATVGELQTFYERRQWHQLTEALIRATFGASASAGENKAEEQKAEAPAVFDNVNLVNMYNDFVSTFESKISPVSLVRFVAAAASRHLCPSTPATAEQVKAAHDLLDRLKDSDVKKKRLGEGALAYLNHERISFSVRGAGPVLVSASPMLAQLPAPPPHPC